MSECPSASSEADHWVCDIHLDAQLWMVRVVRAALRAALHERHSPQFTELALLLATEVVGNALVHTEQPVTVRLRGDGRVLRCAAHDQVPLLPMRRPAGPEDESGRGLMLVEAYATRWGVRQAPDGSGKEVWFELEEDRCTGRGHGGADDHPQGTVADIRRSSPPGTDARPLPPRDDAGAASWPTPPVAQAWATPA